MSLELAVFVQRTAHKQAVARRTTFSEGLYSGLVASPAVGSSSEGEPQTVAQQRDAKLQLLVEAPAAVEDALASLLNHVDPEVQVWQQLGITMVPAFIQQPASCVHTCAVHISSFKCCVSAVFLWEQVPPG